MLYIVIGENVYRARQEIARISKGFEGEIVSVEGGALTTDRLGDLLAGGNLFSPEQLVIIRDLSANTDLWSTFEKWLPRIADSTTVVLIERAIDKRTKTFKTLRKTASLIEVPHWTEREYRDAEAWVDRMARTSKLKIPKALIADMVRRATHSDDSNKTYIDQMELFQALSSMKGSVEVTLDMIDAVMPPDMNENIFELFTAALDGDAVRLKRMMSHLKVTDDPYKTFGLLANQWFQLVSLAATDVPPNDVAAKLGVHPYPLQKLAGARRKFSRVELSRLTKLLSDLDYETKTSATDPWYAIERFLFAVIHRI